MKPRHPGPAARTFSIALCAAGCVWGALVLRQTWLMLVGLALCGIVVMASLHTLVNDARRAFSRADARWVRATLPGSAPSCLHQNAALGQEAERVLAFLFRLTGFGSDAWAEFDRVVLSLRNMKLASTQSRQLHVMRARHRARQALSAAQSQRLARVTAEVEQHVDEFAARRLVPAGASPGAIAEARTMATAILMGEFMNETEWSRVRAPFAAFLDVDEFASPAGP